MALVRKELVRPTQAQLAGDDAFRFRHLLIRDAAYDALPKAARAELHERFADWLAERAADLVEYDEIAGYHLEQAHGYRVELGVADDHTERLARRAADRLVAAGERAFARRDVAAAIGLLEHTLALLPVERRPLEVELKLVDAYMFAGDLARSLELADALIARAAADGDRSHELRARLARAGVAQQAEAQSGEDLRHLAEEAIRVFENADDDAGLAAAWFALAQVEHVACCFRAREHALQRAREHAARAGDAGLEQTMLVWTASAYTHGPFHVEEGLAWFEEHAELAVHAPVVLNLYAGVWAMQGDFTRARELLARGREGARELGQRLFVAEGSMEGASVELLAGEAERSAELALSGCAELEALGERGWLSTLAGQAAEALYRLGRDEEAQQWTDVAEQTGAEDDIATQVLLRQVRAKLSARRGEHSEAERLAREAVALAEPTDMLPAKADAYVDLAHVLATARHRDEAFDALEEAAALYREKGHVVGLRNTERLLDELGPPAAL